MFSKQNNYFNQFRAINVVFFQCLLFMMFSGMATFVSAQDTFISEIYFFSGNTGDEEAIEIAGPTGSSLEGWQLLLYDGTTGLVYNSHTFGADAVFPYTVTLEEQDYGTIVQYYGVNGIQDGLIDGDGIALVHSSGNLIEFWSYGGEFMAVNGAALGQISQNIGATEPIVAANGLFSFNRRCLPPINLICGPTDIPYIPGPKELLTLDYWLEFLDAFIRIKPMVCGTYIKTTQAEGNPEDLFYDRFGNSYSYNEMREAFNNSKNLECNLDFEKFELLIQNSSYNGEVLPTPEQINVICAVFSYLDEIIEIPSTGSKATISIGYDPNLIGSGIIAYGSSSYTADCGTGFGLVQRQLLTTYNSIISSDFNLISHGTINFAPNINYYTGIDINDESDAPPVSDPIQMNQYDFYTILLHEAMHLLGITSRVEIGENGNSVSDFFTLWDHHLLSPSGQPMIEAIESSSAKCCKDYKFNQAEDAFPNMPDDILEGCGDVLFNIPELPPVNGEYDTPNGLDRATIINMLSHLDATRSCNEEDNDFVMHYNIFSGLLHPEGFSNIRRRLTDIELKILCELGYSINDVCNSQCVIIVEDDGAFIINDNISITYGELLANDFILDDNYEISFDFGCGDIGNLIIMENQAQEKINIDINNTPFGNYSFCYTITGCDENFCQTGEVILIAAEKIDPKICSEDCNFVGYGDFSLFQPSNFPGPGPLYYSGLVSPYDSEIIHIQGSQNTVDICFDETDNNQYLRFSANNGVGENVLLPLCKEIAPGCNINLQLDACTINETGVLGVWALHNLPTNLELFEEITCENTLFDDAGNEIGFCMGTIDIGTCGGNLSSNFNCFNSIEFNNRQLFSVNNSQNAITHIWIFSTPESESSFYFIDNVEVNTNCENTLITNSEIVSTCLEESVEIEIEVCLEGLLNSNPSGAIIEVNLPNLTGISLSNENTDFINGIATIENLQPNSDCKTISLFIDFDENFQEGTQINISLAIEASNACLSDGNNEIVNFTLEDCCPNAPISGFETQGGECNHEVIFTSADQNQEWIHSWTFGDGNSSTAINPTNTYINEGVYPITHTVSSDCEISTTQGFITIDCLDFCEEEEQNTDIIIGENENSMTNMTQVIPQENLNPSETENKSFFIHGTLVIDQSYTFRHCEFIMGPNAAIHIDASLVEILGNGHGSSQIYGCEYLWKGIKIIEGYNYTLRLTGTYVSDAQYAVQATSKTNIELINNIFDRNLVGLYTAIVSGSTQNVLSSANITFNIFECTSNLKLPHPDFPLDNNGLPAPEEVSYAGMVLHDLAGISIGSQNATSPSNIFRNLSNGILTTNTNLFIYSTRFVDIGQVPNYNTRGYGIRMVGKVTQLLLQQGLGKDGIPSFENCRFGIYAQNTNIRVLKDNNIVNVDQGVTVTDPNSQLVIIQNNRLQCNEKGIAIRNIGQANNLRISNNILNVGHPNAFSTSAYAIEVSSSIVPDVSEKFYGTIKDNIIRAYQRQAAIGILNSQGINVINNQISLDESLANMDGILVQSSSMINVRENQIQRNDVFNTNQLNMTDIAGIRVVNSANCSYCCNEVALINYGVVFDGMTNNPSVLAGTQFKDHFQGLRVTDGTEIGVQPNRGNCWEGSYGNFEAIHEGDLGDINASQFAVNGNIECNVPNLIFPAEGWFGPSSALSFSCDGDISCDELMLRCHFTTRDEITAGNTEPYDNLVRRFEQGRQLYRKIDETLTTCIETPIPSEIFTFYVIETPTIIGQFRTIEKGMIDLWDLDEPTRTSIDTYTTDMTSIFEAIAEKDVALQTASGQDSIQLQEDKIILYKELSIVANDRLNLFETIKNECITKANALILVNNDISATEIFEVNEKTVNDIYLRTIAQHIIEFTAEQLTALENIAFQCPEEGGYAIYRAQSLLLLTDNVYDFNHNCDNIGLRNSNHKIEIKEEKQTLVVSPNPAQSILEVSIRETFDKNVPIEIIDIYGKIISTFILPAQSESVQLNLNNTSSGMYFLRLKTSTDSILSTKIIISK